jgi:hypothetical protein
MEARSVPRNIDKPNRTPEYATTFLATYYLVMFLTQKALFAIVAAAFATYMMYKITLDKPEGLAFRMVYRKIQLGKMSPTPARCKKLDV